MLRLNLNYWSARRNEGIESDLQTSSTSDLLASGTGMVLAQCAGKGSLLTSSTEDRTFVLAETLAAQGTQAHSSRCSFDRSQAFIVSFDITEFNVEYLLWFQKLPSL